MPGEDNSCGIKNAFVFSTHILASVVGIRMINRLFNSAHTPHTHTKT